MENVRFCCHCNNRRFDKINMVSVYNTKEYIANKYHHESVTLVTISLPLLRIGNA